MLESEDGTVLAAEGEAIGTATNNVAEYSGLVAGLQKALELHVPELEVVSDSELMVKQMRGEYRVKNDALRELSTEAGRLARQIGNVSYNAVRREHRPVLRLEHVPVRRWAWITACAAVGEQARLHETSS